MKSSTNDENDYNENRLQSKTIIKSRVDGKPIQMVKRSKIFMYSYGCPKVGNGIFSQFYDRVVPNSYRIVVDGDLVTGLPPGGYFFSTYVHIGTEILIDSVGAGSIIIDPSFVERWLRTTLKSSVALHSLFAYRKGLLGIRLAAEFMRKYAEDFRGLDPLKVALHAGPIITQKVDELLAPPDSSIEGSKADPPTDKQIVIEREYQISETVSEESAVPEVAVTQEGLVSAMKDLSALTKETTGEISEKKEDEDTARENLDAKHYAHDVEFASTLMSQFEGAGGVSVYGIGKTGIDTLGNISSWLYGTTTGIFYGESTENTTEKNLVEEDKVF